MLALVLFLILLFVIAGFIGALVHGLIWLTIVAVVLGVLTLLVFGGRLRGRSR